MGCIFISLGTKSESVILQAKEDTAELKEWVQVPGNIQQMTAIRLPCDDILAFASCAGTGDYIQIYRRSVPSTFTIYDPPSAVPNEYDSSCAETVRRRNIQMDLDGNLLLQRGHKLCVVKGIADAKKHPSSKESVVPDGFNAGVMFGNRVCVKKPDGTFSLIEDSYF